MPILYPSCLEQTEHTVQNRENTEIGHSKFEYFVFKMHKMSNTTTYSMDGPQQLLKIYIPLKQQID